MGGPGDRASKHGFSREPTLSKRADGHGEIPKKVDLESSLPPGSKSSASAHMSHAREPGDLGGANAPMVARGHRREGIGRNPQETSEESDAFVAPRVS